MQNEAIIAVHATAVAISGRALLILGPSRAGKSRLALALIAASTRRRPIRLIGDDRVLLVETSRGLVARPHPRIAGFIERRGLGIVAMRHMESAPVAAVAALERFPLGWTHPSDKTSLHLQYVRAFPDAKPVSTFAGNALEQRRLLPTCSDQENRAKTTNYPSRSDSGSTSAALDAAWAQNFPLLPLVDIPETIERCVSILRWWRDEQSATSASHSFGNDTTRRE